MSSTRSFPGILRPILLVAAMATGCATSVPETPAGLTLITLHKPVHFTAPDGGNVRAAAGRYDVQTPGESQLLLAPAEGAGDGSPLLVQARPLPHEESLVSGVALAIPQGDTEQHVVLLLPEGKGYDAVGLYDTVQPRGLVPSLLSFESIREALKQKLATPLPHGETGMQKQ